ncbi:MAG: DUF192 domain-containing protein [Candidatus Woesearchaeota archaeon]
MELTVYKGSNPVSQPRLARTQWEKARGLMFSRPHDVLFEFGEEEKLKFHMVFVFYPIDIIFMDKQMRVVDLKERFRPFTFYYSKACSSTVLEAYHGFIKEHGISIGDELTVEHGKPSLDTRSPPSKRRYAPHGRMLHTTSLGATRTAKTKPASQSDEPSTPHILSEKPVRSKPKKRTPAKKPAKPTTKTTRKTPPKTTKKVSKPARKPTRKAPTKTTTKKSTRKTPTKKPSKSQSAKRSSARSTKRQR